ncbi:MAG: hypothetical protein K2Q17_11955 [Nitrospiraceae bacterium]|jgi:hypothetical protein|nr:hypothetical protein [Nitrospiraceae bacterium]
MTSYEVFTQLKLAIIDDNMAIEGASAYRLAKIVLHAEPSSAVDKGCDSAR